MPLTFKGTLVPIASANPRDLFEGRVTVDESGSIIAIRRDGEATPAGFDEGRIVGIEDAFIYPGLVDLHSHLGYNALPLWVQPGESSPFLHHDIWPRRSSYKPDISWPAWVLAKAAPEALLTYVQVRALAGGTTTIQGWPSMNRHPANRLVRTADDQVFDGVHDGRDRVRTSTLTLSTDDLEKKADDLDDGLGFIYHCAEGQRDSLVAREFEALAATNCLRRNLIAIHCCAIEGEAFERWKVRAELAGDPGPGALVWSPFSNLWLYGQTTDVPAAREQGVGVCLGTDWGPSGTKNLLGELKVAKLIVEDRGWAIDAFDLVEMVTGTPGDALARCWGRQAGRLEPGALADIAVVERSHDDPFENLVLATEKNVLLVVVDGQLQYATTKLMKACGQHDGDAMRPGGNIHRRVFLTNPADKNKPPEERTPWTWDDVLDRLEAVRADPIATVEAADAPTAAEGRVSSAIGPEGDTLVLDLDMPGAPGVVAGPPPPDVRVDIEPFPSLRHDKPWLASLKNRGFHGGLLNGMRRFMP
jgi:5-methylthioadenosine/S-adenosylhomocysteine deaminase